MKARTCAPASAREQCDSGSNSGSRCGSARSASRQRGETGGGYAWSWVTLVPRMENLLPPALITHAAAECQRAGRAWDAQGYALRSTHPCRPAARGSGHRRTASWCAAAGAGRPQSGSGCAPRSPAVAGRAISTGARDQLRGPRTLVQSEASVRFTALRGRHTHVTHTAVRHFHAAATHRVSCSMAQMTFWLVLVEGSEPVIMVRM